MSAKKKTSDDIFNALSEMETELIALKDVMDIMNKIPMEYPRPVYLVNRIATHTESLDKKFKKTWESMIECI